MPAEPFLERLMNTYGDELLRMCFLYLKDYQLAEDAVQDTFLKAMKSYQFFQHQSSEKTWLTRIAINCCKNVIRTRWFRMRHVNMEADTESKHNDPIENIVEKKQHLRCYYGIKCKRPADYCAVLLSGIVCQRNCNDYWKIGKYHNPAFKQGKR